MQPSIDLNESARNVLFKIREIQVVFEQIKSQGIKELQLINFSLSLFLASDILVATQMLHYNAAQPFLLS